MPLLDEETPLTGPERYGRRLKLFDDVIRPVAAEFVGTTLFVFIGVLASYGGNIVAVALAHGLAIALLVTAFAPISGGHFNPAVTFGAWISGAISWPLGVFYFAAQMTGGILGAALAYAILNFVPPDQSDTAFASISGGGQTLTSGVSLFQGFLTEAVLTFILLNSVLLCAVDSDGENVLAPLAIGFSVLVDILAGGNISGASMNPARTFGPAVVASGTIDLWINQWIYWAGPAVGALLAALFYRFLFIKPDRRSFLKDA